MLETQISALDEASARADVRTETVAARLGSERERIDIVAASLTETATARQRTGRGPRGAAEGDDRVGRRHAQERRASCWRRRPRASAAPPRAAAEAPHAAAVELDKQAKHIEAVSDAAMARAEFLLGRHERHRTAMGELLQRLKEEGGALEAALASSAARWNNPSAR